MWEIEKEVIKTIQTGRYLQPTCNYGWQTYVVQSHSEYRKLLLSGTELSDASTRTIVCLYNRSADSVVIIVTKLRTGQSGI
jgi:hypothetical protein